MQNTRTEYGSAERMPVVLPEMEQLLPPLSAEQLSALEGDILENGCYTPIITNEDMVIVDGHNLYPHKEVSQNQQPNPINEQQGATRPPAFSWS